MSRPISPYERIMAERRRMERGQSRAGARSISIRIPDEMHATLGLIARVEGTSMGEQLRRAVDAYIAAHEAR
jgi:hypothetical protein